MELSTKENAIHYRIKRNVLWHKHVVFRTHNKYFVFKHPLGVKSSNTSEQKYSKEKVKYDNDSVYH